MVYSELIVWAVAISANVYFLIFNPEIYSKTLISNTFYKILTKPWPNYLIILLSAFGTFLSLYFGDELLDILENSQRVRYLKYRSLLSLATGIFLVVIFYYLYKYFLNLFGLNI